MEVWQNSRLNKLQPEVIVKNSSYIWGFGDNQKRALAVQSKSQIVAMPDYSAGSCFDDSIIV